MFSAGLHAAPSSYCSQFSGSANDDGRALSRPTFSGDRNAICGVKRQTQRVIVNSEMYSAYDYTPVRRRTGTIYDFMARLRVIRSIIRNKESCAGLIGTNCTLCIRTHEPPSSAPDASVSVSHSYRVVSILNSARRTPDICSRRRSSPARSKRANQTSK